jgi:tRNA pseudouridine55 synthase
MQSMPDVMHVGLLIICVGKGTKSSNFFMAQDKVYSGIFKLGEATPSFDAETAVCQHEPWEHLTDEGLQEAASKHFTGNLQQV